LIDSRLPDQSLTDAPWREIPRCPNTHSDFTADSEKARLFHDLAIHTGAASKSALFHEWIYRKRGAADTKIIVARMPIFSTI
jgi:hypothetical protein